MKGGNMQMEALRNRNTEVKPLGRNPSFSLVYLILILNSNSEGLVRLKVLLSASVWPRAAHRIYISTFVESGLIVLE